VEITGADRATLLHGLCTNDIKGLTPNRGCEAFLTNVQGKTVGYVYVFCGDESLILDTVGGQAEFLIQSLDRYVIREDVALSNRSSLEQVAVCGNKAPETLQRILGIPVPSELLNHISGESAGETFSLRKVPYGGENCFFVAGSAAFSAALQKALQGANARKAEATAAEVLRLESGTPIFGVEVTDKNLPQEIDRNEQAISFTKGCYLGQETVARLDALGHVNRRLRGLVFSGLEVPARGSQISRDAKVVAEITSASWSFRRSAPLALAFVRRGCDAAGTQLESEFGSAEVVDLPLG
jgi:folate-binding protein YgfZ